MSAIHLDDGRSAFVWGAALSLLSSSACVSSETSQTEIVGASPVFEDDSGWMLDDVEYPGDADGELDELDDELLAQTPQRTVTSDGGPLCGNSNTLEGCEHRTSVQPMTFLYYREGVRIARGLAASERSAAGRPWYVLVDVFFEYRTRPGEWWVLRAPLPNRDIHYILDPGVSAITGVDAWIPAETICGSVLHPDVQAYLGLDFTNEVRFLELVLDPEQRDAPRTALRRNFVTCN